MSKFLMFDILRERGKARLNLLTVLITIIIFY